MQTRKIKVGINSPIRFYVEVDYNAPENISEIKKLTDNEEYIAQCFVRGDVINHQDRSGARSAVERAVKIARAEARANGKELKSMEDFSTEQFNKIRAIAQKEFDSFERGAERQRRTILTLTKEQYDAIPEATRAEMTAQGIIFDVKIASEVSSK
jgi:hypothetical protein